MNEQCKKILTLFKDKATAIDFRRLLLMIDHHYWDDFVNDREQITSYVNQLVKDELITQTVNVRPDGQEWKGYVITGKGNDYLMQIEK